MATSKCGACNSTTFEIKENSPKGSNFKLYVFQCASWGAVVGGFEYQSNNVLLDKLSDAVRKIGRQLNVSTGL